ncbi:hypothetical protein [Marinicellulosiphila megalodicopiae]|uniref:hypothetical protein n=1 Tax=Marinicellulosiphila megalodicopiae TaxID=2724896 RepID=UPI003BB11B1C
MNIVDTAIRSLKITGVERLDPVSVYIEGYVQGKGKLTVECFGKSWSAFWGAIGKKTVEEFILSSDICYLANSLWDHSKEQYEDDLTGVTQYVRKTIIERRREEFVCRDTARAIYDIEDWEYSMPQHPYDEFHKHDDLSEYQFIDAQSILENYNIEQKQTSEYAYLNRIVSVVQDALKQLSEKESK